MTAEHEITGGRVDVWCADPDELEATERFDAACALLTPEELVRMRRFRFERDRRIQLATRALVRTVLSKYEDVPPAAWRFEPSDKGRPEIAHPASSLRFNLSNSRGLVACAVVREVDVGVDVEPLDRRWSMKIAERFFSPAEVAALRALPDEARPRRFLDLWTLKESYIKARGLGLALPLDRFSFVLEEGRPPRVEIDAELGDRGESWQFAQLEPAPRHVLALCVRRCSGDGSKIVLRELPFEAPPPPR